MWAFVAIKGQPKRFLGESLSKSPGFSNWGQPVRLRAEVPLASKEEAHCQTWPQSEENEWVSYLLFCQQTLFTLILLLQEEKGVLWSCGGLRLGLWLCQSCTHWRSFSETSAQQPSKKMRISSRVVVLSYCLLYFLPRKNPGVRRSGGHYSLEQASVLVQDAEVPLVGRGVEPQPDHSFHRRLLLRTSCCGKIIRTSRHSG